MDPLLSELAWKPMGLPGYPLCSAMAPYVSCLSQHQVENAEPHHSYVPSVIPVPG